MKQPANTAVTATIHYRIGDRERHWRIGCLDGEDQDSFRRHLEKWIPGAEFLGAQVDPPRPKLRAQPKAPPTPLREVAAFLGTGALLALFWLTAAVLAVEGLRELLNDLCQLCQ